jgi:hypothetical protein
LYGGKSNIIEASSNFNRAFSLEDCHTFAFETLSDTLSAMAASPANPALNETPA